MQWKSRYFCIFNSCVASYPLGSQVFTGTCGSGLLTRLCCPHLTEFHPSHDNLICKICFWSQVHCYENFSPNKLHFLVKMKPLIQLSLSDWLQVRFGYRKDSFIIQAMGSNNHLSTEMQAHGLIGSYDHLPGHNVRGNNLVLEEGKEICGTLAN